MNTASDLCNKLQHDANATLGIALLCISSSALYMGLVHLAMAPKQLLVKRPFYKCPISQEGGIVKCHGVVG